VAASLGTVPIFVAGGHKNGTVPFGRLELILIAAAIALPLAMVGWRLLMGGAGSQAVLAFEWPEQRRPGTTLQLDGVEQEVALAGPLEYACLPGEVDIVVTPQGGPPFRRSVLLAAGETTVVRIPWHEFDLTGRWPAGGLPQELGKSPPGPQIAEKGTSGPARAAQGGAASEAQTGGAGPRGRPSVGAASPVAEGSVVFPSSDPNFSRVLGPVAVARWQRWAARTRQIQQRAVAPAEQGHANAISNAEEKGVAGRTAVPGSESPSKASQGL